MDLGLKTQQVENHNALVMTNGYTVYFHTTPALGILQALVVGVDVFHWTTLSRVSDADDMLTSGEIIFGGSIRTGVMNFAAHWMLENVMTAVRWENACVAPLSIQVSASTKRSSCCI
ncbi:hypothetical protein PR003_g28903 [Phytophthora rubi]|uniref:Uncharacterized protein n=1 Tax=Phytophthora rubi TaxID=129364 RepID=A0A6A4BMZ1_9STRA|nr:hypothetical protein PR003_g28903 [Phytophthora rubi]